MSEGLVMLRCLFILAMIMPVCGCAWLSKFDDKKDVKIGDVSQINTRAVHHSSKFEGKSTAEPHAIQGNPEWLKEIIQQ